MSKKTVLINGCSEGGIGAAMAKAFRDQGHHVFATLRNTAKAGSLAQLDNIDILELEVNITTLVESVHTPIHNNAGELKLPADSYSQQIRDIISTQRKALLKPNSQGAYVTARSIVHDVVSSRSGLIWRGGLASVCRYLTWLLPAGLLGHVLNGYKGLSDVKYGEK